jgi:hypothetical protein
MGRTAHGYQRTALSPVKARFGYSTADDIAARGSIRQRETMVGEELSHWQMRVLDIPPPMIFPQRSENEAIEGLLQSPKWSSEESLYVP